MERNEVLSDDVWKAFLNLVAYKTLNTNVYLLKDKKESSERIAHSDTKLSPFCEWIQSTKCGKEKCAADHEKRGRMDNAASCKTHLCWAGMNNRLVILNHVERLCLLAGQIKCKSWQKDARKKIEDAISMIWENDEKQLKKQYKTFDNFKNEGLKVHDALPTYPDDYLRSVSNTALKIFKKFFKKEIIDRIHILSIFQESVRLGGSAEDYYTHVAKKVTELLHARSSSILLNNLSTPHLFHISGSTEVVREDFNNVEYNILKPCGKSGYVLSTGRPLLVDDAGNKEELLRKTNFIDFNWDGPEAQMSTPNFKEKAWIGVPIFRAGEEGQSNVAGMIRAGKEKGIFDLEDLAEILVFSNLLSNILSTRHWFNERQNALYFMERLFASSPDPVIYSTFRSEKGKGGIIEKINPAVTEMLGYTEEALLGRHVYIPYGYNESKPETLERAKKSAHIIKEKLLAEWERQRLKENIDTYLQIQNFPVSLFTKSGEERRVWLSASLVEDVRLPAGDINRIIGVIGIFRDRDEIERLRNEIHERDIALKKQAAELKRLSGAGIPEKERLKKRCGEFGIITESDKILECFRLVEAFSVTESPVLITGERGVGKELFARAIHLTSKRARGQFLPVTSLAPTLADSELFGYEKGSFTGASISRKGKFETAAGGTVFLDDFDTFPLEIQGKLLRVLQDGEIQKIGYPRPVKADVRILAATNADLQKLSHEGKFRRDLVDRINVLNINIPSLRDRKEDITLLMNHYLKLFTEKYNKNPVTIPGNVYKLILDYPWHGNVRELMNFANRLVIEAGIEGQNVEEIIGKLLQQPVRVDDVTITDEQGPSLDFTNVPRGQRRRAIVADFLYRNPEPDTKEILSVMKEHGLSCDRRTVQLHLKTCGFVLENIKTSPSATPEEIRNELLQEGIKDTDKTIRVTLDYLRPR